MYKHRHPTTNNILTLHNILPPQATLQSDPTRRPTAEALLQMRFFSDIDTCIMQLQVVVGTLEGGCWGSDTHGVLRMCGVLWCVVLYVMHCVVCGVVRVVHTLPQTHAP